MIWNFVPYCPVGEGDPEFVGRDLGSMYNRYMDKLAPGDWACFLDHDTMQTTRKWYRLLEKAVVENPDAGVFIATASRLNPKVSGWQMAGDRMRACDNVVLHWKEGERRYTDYGSTAIDVTDIEGVDSQVPMSGAGFCISVDAWRAMGEAPAGFVQVDWRIHRRLRAAGYRVYHLPGWYMYHWFKRVRHLSDFPESNSQSGNM